MLRLPKNRAGMGGFSLIEMMVSMAILILITVYMTDLLLRQSRTYTVLDQVSEIQQNIRAISDLVEREIRTTGFMTEEAGVVCAVDLLNAPDILVVTDAAVFDPTDQNASDMGVDISELEYTGVGTDTFNVSTLVDTTASHDIDGDGTPDSDFFDLQPAAAAPWPQGQSGGVIIYDRNDPTAGTSCGRVVRGSLSATQVQVDYTFGLLPAVYAPVALSTVGADLRMVPAVVYQVDQLGALAVPPVTSRLLRNGLVIAEDVEDLQLAMWFDADTDGTQDNGEYWGSDPANPLTGGSYVSSARDHREVREIRVSLMLRTRQQDPNVLATTALPQGQFQNMENRNTAAPARDAFVRRIQTLTIRPRNVGRRTNSL